MKFPYYRKFIQFESQQVVDGVMLNNYVTDIQHNSKLINYNETQSSVTIGGWFFNRGKKRFLSISIIHHPFRDLESERQIMK